VVYTDYQRLELEKEFHMNHYTTIKRKADLAAQLRLTERQVNHVFLLMKILKLLRRTIIKRIISADKDLVPKSTGERAEANEKATRTNKRAADENARRCGGLHGGSGGWRYDGLFHQWNGDGWDAGRSDADQREHFFRASFNTYDVDISTHIIYISTHIFTYDTVATYIATGVAAHDTAYAISRTF